MNRSLEKLHNVELSSYSVSSTLTEDSVLHPLDSVRTRSLNVKQCKKFHLTGADLVAGVQLSSRWHLFAKTMENSVQSSVSARRLCPQVVFHKHFDSILVSFFLRPLCPGADAIIRQHKAACLRITALLACKDLLWIGTSAGKNHNGDVAGRRCVLTLKWCPLVVE